ncbi:hypothetical protein HNR19_003229 [Nocardioides thalensis]|uniref:Uncharacterized protein n=1 Tax=Nocardioides thalensis TaxID=1914755 RepID=A0A853C5U5_9ACTN|nr:hypothetical protein [Nocardioides thalensis]NYJ02531.1 hypothetical protein [Nocardioides thalensis]
MSKEAAVRAMREARYNRMKQAPPQPAADGLCGHRSMNGRTCTREQGHAAKTHRYS